MTQTTRLTGSQLAEALRRIATTTEAFVGELEYQITTDDKDLSVSFCPLTTEVSRPS